MRMYTNFQETLDNTILESYVIRVMLNSEYIKFRTLRILYKTEAYLCRNKYLESY